MEYVEDCLEVLKSYGVQIMVLLLLSGDGAIILQILIKTVENMYAANNIMIFVQQYP